QDGAAAPSLRKERMDRDPGGRAFLDHHHAPVPARAVDLEAEVAVIDLKDQPVLILGLGASGLAMARWCARRGAQVTVADTRDEPPQLQAMREQLPQARFIGGPFSADLVAPDTRAVFRSPGLSPQQVAIVLAAARARGVLAGGELSLFAGALADLREREHYAPAVLAVTGTNGKTTVTALTGQLVERSGRTVAVAGNIGPTLLDTLAEKIDAGALPQVWVIELSSFQLDTAGDFEPTAAAVLNVTQDHLDWHGTMEAYAAAKARVFGSKALMILNREDSLVMKMLPGAAGSLQGARAPSGGSAAASAASVGANKSPVRVKGGRMEQRPYLTFGGDLPARPGDFGIEVVNGMAWLVRALEADETQRRRPRIVPGQLPATSAAAEEELHIQRLMPADALRI